MLEGERGTRYIELLNKYKVIDYAEFNLQSDIIKHQNKKLPTEGFKSHLLTHHTMVRVDQAQAMKNNRKILQCGVNTHIPRSFK